MSTIDVKVPAIGGFKDVGVIDILVKAGDAVKVDASLVTLESDKATMDVPSPAAGVVKDVRVKLGDRVSEGSPIVTLEEGSQSPASAPKGAPAGAEVAGEVRKGTSESTAAKTEVAAPRPAAAPPAPAEPVVALSSGRSHASPSVRRVARDLGVDLVVVAGTGPRGRILKEDIQRFVKEALAGSQPSQAGAARSVGLDLLPWPRVDFAAFGPVEAKPLSRIKRISGANLARNWVMIPHVTQFDEADITDLEALRTSLNEESGTKVTLLAFLVKACVAALRKFPEVNASLDGESLVFKRYFHIGFAADTPGGLVVPVVKNADQKGVLDIAKEASELAAKAREGKLSPADMQGGSFSISSLGGIGGTAFTPIINAPEVAILGVSKMTRKPVFVDGSFVPRLILPLSLSYDHRVVDGATAARFTSYLAVVLADLRRAML
jgi:pyruvate dehydrogenase E2 component (dihydrolipoamide acetyltransferase)